VYIAIEVGSLKGVKITAWPGVLNWKSGNTGKTALQFFNSQWGPRHN